MSLLYGDEVAKAIEVFLALAYMYRANLFQDFWETNNGRKDVLKFFRTKLRRSTLMRMKLELRKYLKWKAERYQRGAMPIQDDDKRPKALIIGKHLDRSPMTAPQDNIREMNKEAYEIKTSSTRMLRPHVAMSMEGVRELDGMKNKPM